MVKSSVSSMLAVFLGVMICNLSVDAGDVAPAESIFNTGKVKEIYVAPAIAAGLAIAMGLVVCFYGYRLFHTVLFLCGFIVGGILSYMVIEKLFGDKDWAKYGVWIAFVVGGIIVGFLIGSFVRLGIFLVGAAAGILLAFSLNTSFMYKLWPSNPDAMLYILIVVLGLLGGFLALWLEAPFIIVATSFFGSNSAVWGIGYFAGNYPSGSSLKSLGHELADGSWQIDIPNEWWGYFAGIVFLFIAGIVIQFKYTRGSKDHYHNI